MKTKLSRSQIGVSAALSVAALSGVAFLATSGGESASAGEQASAEGPRPEASKVENDRYAVEMTAPGAVKAGAEGAIEVTIVARGEYHMSPRYPYKMKLDEPAQEGLRFPKPVLTREDGTFDASRGVFRVPFVAAKAGPATVSGTVSVSVCSAASCVMDRVPLEVTVAVR